MTYPDGVVLEYLYTDAAGDALSRVRTLRFDAVNVCSYVYAGLSTIVRTDYSEPEVRLTTLLGTGTNPYAALDRFGRVIDQRWQTFGPPVASLVQLKYGYDRASNRLWKEDVQAAAAGVHLDELYTYDGMDRLEAFARGNLTSGNTAIASATAEQAWDLDSVGNWENFSEDLSGVALNQQRTFNTANEITDIARTIGPNWGDPVYDAAGNMNRITRRNATPALWRATWDAWNRLVKLEESTGPGTWVVKEENAYDGSNRRTVRKTYTSGVLDETRHYYWTASWQNIEERVVVSSTQEPERQYVYGLRYVDDVVLRDRDTNLASGGSGVFDERLYAMQDANWNVVALCDASAAVQKRYAYLPYGETQFFDASFVAGGANQHWTKRFASYEFDSAVDLCQVRWRWYSPLLGNWTSRDPIGYRDGMSLYAAYFVPGDVDPLGLVRLVFDADAFIPQAWVSIPTDIRTWHWRFGASSYVSGNDRGFSPTPLRAQSKIWSYIEIETCACDSCRGATRKKVVLDSGYGIGLSTRLDFDEVTGYRQVTHDEGVIRPRTGAAARCAPFHAPIAGMRTQQACFTDVVISASGNVPWSVAILPFGINYDYHIQVMHRGDVVSYTVRWTHDGFPAHEFYISHNESVVYNHSFAPPGTDWIGSPSRLAGVWDQQSGSITGHIHTSQSCNAC